MDHTQEHQSRPGCLPLADQAVRRSAGRVSLRRGKGVVERSKQLDAIAFDAPKIEAIKLNHRGSHCSFEAILEDYAVSDPAFQKLALIVRAADVKDQESAAPEGIGLRSIAQGFAALGISDEERLVRQFPVYDALYAYVQSNR